MENEITLTPKEKIIAIIIILIALSLLLWDGRNTERAIQDCLNEGHTQEFCDGLR